MRIAVIGSGIAGLASAQAGTGLRSRTRRNAAITRRPYQVRSTSHQ